jgi:hypothetical protein
MFDHNEKFRQWRYELEQRGVSIRWLWSAKSNPKMRYDDIALASFYGNRFSPEGFSPNESTAVIQDFEAECHGSSRNNVGAGFGVWFQSSHSSIVGEAEHIAKPHEQ